MDEVVSTQYFERIIQPMEHWIVFIQRRWRRSIQLLKFSKYIERVMVLNRFHKCLEKKNFKVSIEFFLYRMS